LLPSEIAAPAPAATLRNALRLVDFSAGLLEWFSLMVSSISPAGRRVNPFEGTVRFCDKASLTQINPPRGQLAAASA
jgi:hypothetical protein